MLCYHIGGQLDMHILLLWQPAIVFFAIVFVLFYVCLANKLSLSLNAMLRVYHFSVTDTQLKQYSKMVGPKFLDFKTTPTFDRVPTKVSRRSAARARRFHAQIKNAPNFEVFF